MRVRNDLSGPSVKFMVPIFHVAICSVRNLLLQIGGAMGENELENTFQAP